MLRVGVLDLLVPLLPEVANWTRPPREALARIRQSGTFVVHATAGEKIAAAVANVRVSHYTDTLSWRLLGPDLERIQAGTIAVDKSATIAHAAQTSGDYYLEVVPKQGSAEVQFGNRAVAEIATPEQALTLFNSDITRHFFVPDGAKQFELAAQDGGPTEGARIVVTSPAGRVAFEADGNFNAARHAIEVRPGEAGQVWTIRIEPRQDFSLWLTGDVMPYLSTSPERVLIRTQSGRMR